MPERFDSAFVATPPEAAPPSRHISSITDTERPRYEATLAVTPTAGPTVSHGKSWHFSWQVFSESKSIVA